MALALRNLRRLIGQMLRDVLYRISGYWLLRVLPRRSYLVGVLLRTSLGGGTGRVIGGWERWHVVSRRGGRGKFGRIGAFAGVVFVFSILIFGSGRSGVASTTIGLFVRVW